MPSIKTILSVALLIGSSFVGAIDDYGRSDSYDYGNSNDQMLDNYYDTHDLYDPGQSIGESNYLDPVFDNSNNPAQVIMARAPAQYKPRIQDQDDPEDLPPNHTVDITQLSTNTYLSTAYSTSTQTLSAGHSLTNAHGITKVLERPLATTITYTSEDEWVEIWSHVGTFSKVNGAISVRVPALVGILTAGVGIFTGIMAYAL